jgi:hypothetical protein
MVLASLVCPCIAEYYGAERDVVVAANIVSSWSVEPYAVFFTPFAF